MIAWFAWLGAWNKRDVASFSSMKGILSKLMKTRCVPIQNVCFIYYVWRFYVRESPFKTPHGLWVKHSNLMTARLSLNIQLEINRLLVVIYLRVSSLRQANHGVFHVLVHRKAYIITLIFRWVARTGYRPNSWCVWRLALSSVAHSARKQRRRAQRDNDYTATTLNKITFLIKPQGWNKSNQTLPDVPDEMDFVTRSQEVENLSHDGGQKLACVQTSPISLKKYRGTARRLVKNAYITPLGELDFRTEPWTCTWSECAAEWLESRVPNITTFW